MYQQIMMEIDALEAYLDAFPKAVLGKSTESVLTPLRSYLGIQRRLLAYQVKVPYVLTAFPDWGGSASVKRASSESDWIPYGGGDVRIELYKYPPDTDLVDYLRIEGEELSGTLQEVGGPLKHIWLVPGEYLCDQAFFDRAIYLPSDFYPSPNIDLQMILEMLLAMAWEPADWVLTIRDLLRGDIGIGWATLSFLPFLSSRLRQTDEAIEMITHLHRGDAQSIDIVLAFAKSQGIENLDGLVTLFGKLEPEEFDTILRAMREYPEDVVKLLKRDLSKYEKIGFDELRYSQGDVSDELRTMGGKTEKIEDVAERMREFGWDFGYDVPDVVRLPDGEFIIVDHRRLVAAQEAGLEEFPAIVHDFDEPILDMDTRVRFELPDDIDTTTLEELSQELGKTVSEEYLPETWGEAAIMRSIRQRKWFPDFPARGRKTPPSIRR